MITIKNIFITAIISVFGGYSIYNVYNIYNILKHLDECNISLTLEVRRLRNEFVTKLNNLENTYIKRIRTNSKHSDHKYSDIQLRNQQIDIEKGEIRKESEKEAEKEKEKEKEGEEAEKEKEVKEEEDFDCVEINYNEELASVKIPQSSVSELSWLKLTKSVIFG